MKWGKKHLPRLKRLWDFYSGKSGIGRVVQTSFLFYGGFTTLFLTYFAIRFNVFDGTLGRTLVGNLAFIGFTQIPGGTHPVLGLPDPGGGAAGGASMTAFQDLQATEWRDVAIGEIPEIIVYRNKRGHLHPLGDGQLHPRRRDHVRGARPDDAGRALLRRGRVHADHGDGLGHPQAHPGALHRVARAPGARGAAGFAGVLAAIVFVGQIVGKWAEGGWVVLISFSLLVLAAHALLISPDRLPRPKADPPHRAREGPRAGRDGLHRRMAVAQDAGVPLSRSCWRIARFWELLGVRRPVRYEKPVAAGDYDHALHVDDPRLPPSCAILGAAAPGNRSSQVGRPMRNPGSTGTMNGRPRAARSPFLDRR